MLTCHAGRGRSGTLAAVIIGVKVGKQAARPILIVRRFGQA